MKRRYREIDSESVPVSPDSCRNQSSGRPTHIAIGTLRKILCGRVAHEGSCRETKRSILRSDDTGGLSALRSLAGDAGLESRKQNDVFGRNGLDGKSSSLPCAKPAFDYRGSESVLLQDARDTKTGRLTQASAIKDQFFVFR